MKIITPGRDQRGWARELICTGDKDSGCGAKLLVEEADLFEERHADVTNTTHFICAHCGQENTVPKTVKIPWLLPTREVWEKIQQDPPPPV